MEFCIVYNGFYVERSFQRHFEMTEQINKKKNIALGMVLWLQNDKMSFVNL